MKSPIRYVEIDGQWYATTTVKFLTLEEWCKVNNIKLRSKVNGE